MTITTAQGLAWLLGIVVPLATDVLAKSAAPRATKATIAAVLAALAGVLPTITLTGSTRWQDYAWSVLGAWAVAIATHSTGVSDGVQAATASFGIVGPKTPAAPVPIPHTQTSPAVVPATADSGPWETPTPAREVTP